MNVYIFLVSFSFVYFCFISSTCSRHHERRHVGKKLRHHLSKKALTDELPDKRNLKTSKAGVQSEAVYDKINSLSFKRHDGTVKSRPIKDTRKKSTLAKKKETSANKLREKKDQPHSNLESGKTRGNSNLKTKSKSKKFSLAFAPSSSLTPQAQNEDGYQDYAPQTSGQLRYLTNNLGNAETANQESQDNVAQFTGQQEGFQTMTGGQNEVNAFQDNNNGQEGQESQELGQEGQEAQQFQEGQEGQQGQTDQEGVEGRQSVGTLQQLMEQKALLSQQENPQEGMQGLPNQQQETVAFQGGEQQSREGQFLRQEEDNQQSNAPQGVEQFQQGIGTQETGQQINVQAQGGQDGNNQEINVQAGGEQQGSLLQQGANQEASFQQGNEQLNGEQQGGQMEGSFQQENGPEVLPQQGNEQENFLQQGNEQEVSQQHGEMQDSAAAYQQESGQQGDASEQRGTDGGSIANLFADSNNQGTGQDQETQSLINEGQSITKNDAAQLAAAIANANKGLNTNAEQNSLSNLASNSAGALSFTGSEQPTSNEGLGDLGSTVNRFSPETNQETNGFSLVDHQEENSQKAYPFSQQYEQGSPTTSQSLEQDFMKMDASQEHQQHVNTGIGNIADESVKIVNLDNPVAHRAAKYCTGCPRNARCIDKVCIINDDQPLAKILGALSGPENETDDCRGCHHNAKCIKRECICKPGFTGDGIECRADSCLPGCSKHGKCIRGFCVCDHHHYFNGVECAPYKIRHQECPDKCAESCLPECPDRCCKSHVVTPKPQETTSSAPTAVPTTPTTRSTPKPITKTSNKKVGLDAAADFYLKPTLHNNAEVFNKQLHEEKHLQSSDQVSPSQSSTPNKNSTSSVSNHNVTKVLKLEPEDKNRNAGLKIKEYCHPECFGDKCGPSCPDHCCVLTKPNLQMDFLRAFAERFCPSACQNKCQNTCPPICCEKRSFASILKSSPGASNVDVNKAEDIFRNAMGWFGMMNFLHMMYNMYGNMYKPQNMMHNNNPQNMLANVFRKMQEDQNAKIKAEVPGSLHCEPACAKTCLNSCPPRCCYKKSFLAEEKSQSSYQKYRAQVGQPLLKTNPALRTSCPRDCTTLCSPKCPPSCCLHHSVPKPLSSITSKYTETEKSCKPGCSQRCYPLCMESCCKAMERTVQVRPTTRSSILTTTPTKASYGCPLQCPRSCFPSCSHDCCSAAQQYKPGLLNGQGQYMVSIPCPMECRPFNCLSYCHHECCLRTNKSFQHLAKSQISNPKDASNKETSEGRTNKTGSQMNKMPQTQEHQKKDIHAKRKYIPKSPVYN